MYYDYREAFPSLHWAATGRWTLHLRARNMLQCPPPTPPADLLSPAQLQPGTCYLLHVTCHMSHVTCYMSHVTCYMSYDAFHMSHVIHDMSLEMPWMHACCSECIQPVSHFNLSYVTYVTCDMSHVTCHL